MIMLGLVTPGLATGRQLEGSSVTTTQYSNKRKAAPLRTSKSAFIEFRHSAFPYRGVTPISGKLFIDTVSGFLHGHTSVRGGVYWEHETYSDRRSLLFIPKGFDINRPVAIIVYFHGNKVRLERDVIERQQITRQLDESGLNAVLVCPQLAVDALDSSAGRFWERGFFTLYIEEAIQHLAKLHGNVRAKYAFKKAPVIITAYSGGYLPAAYAADIGDTRGRVKGMILFDSPYDSENVFSRWIISRKPEIFFLSVYGVSARESNHKLKQMLNQHRIRFRSDIPRRLSQGIVAFFNTDEIGQHDEYMTKAWKQDPLKFLLRRIPGYSRAGAKKWHNATRR